MDGQVWVQWVKKGQNSLHFHTIFHPVREKNFCPKTIRKQISGQKFCLTLGYGPEVEWVLTLFDPLCPDLASQGPTPLVIRSTFGGLPNHPPMMLVRSSIPDL